MSRTIVIGDGAGAQRAAALEAANGRTVTLLTSAPITGLLLPEGRGTWVKEGGESAQKLYGTVQKVELERAVLFRGKRWTLPLKMEQLVRLLPPGQLLSTGLGWAKAKAAVELAELIGGGHEQRSYAHWVQRRFGSEALQNVLSSWCTRRFGAPEEVSANVARWVHGQPYESLYAPARPLHLEGVEVEEAKVEKIHNGKVYSSAGTFEGRVLVDAPPAKVLKWLGEAPESAASQDASKMTARHRVTVCLRGAQDLPFESQILDDSVRFYRIIRPGLLPGFEALTDRLCVHYALDAGTVGMPDSALVQETVEGLTRLGIQADEKGATVRWEADYQPLWTGVHQARYRNYLLHLEEKSVIPVGRAGTHSYADPSEELGWLDAVLNPERKSSLRACFRDSLEPGVEDPPRAHLRHLMER